MIAQREVCQFYPLPYVGRFLALKVIDDRDSIVLHVAEAGRTGDSAVDVAIDLQTFEQGKQVVARDVVILRTYPGLGKHEKKAFNRAHIINIIIS